MSEAHLTPYAGLLEGLTNHTVYAKGTIDFEVTIGERPYEKTARVIFMVIDLKSQYNAILGVTAQAALGIVASISHQKIKFSTSTGIACIENKPELFLKVIERKRRQNATKSKGVSPREAKKVKTDEKEIEGISIIRTLSFHSSRAEFKRSRRARRLAAETEHIDIVIESLHDREVTDIRPNDALEDVVINPKYPGQMIKVGLEIPADERKTLIELLRKSWTYSPGP